MRPETQKYLSAFEPVLDPLKVATQKALPLGDEPKAFLNIVIGQEDDGCPICVAAREGKSPAELLALMGVELPEGQAAQVLTVELTEKGVSRG